jgi:hypothetical protein
MSVRLSDRVIKALYQLDTLMKLSDYIKCIWEEQVEIPDNNHNLKHLRILSNLADRKDTVSRPDWSGHRGRTGHWLAQAGAGPALVLLATCMR